MKQCNVNSNRMVTGRFVCQVEYLQRIILLKNIIMVLREILVFNDCNNVILFHTTLFSPYQICKLCMRSTNKSINIIAPSKVNYENST